MSKHDRDGQVNGEGEKRGRFEEESMFGMRTTPIAMFAELLLRMVNELSDDIVSWSIAGDSFIIKKVPAFEEHLPSYYCHGHFTSFVRQLNNYGFRRTKRTASASLSSTVGGKQGVAGATARALPWEEFNNPLFRRGRRDLLVGISKHKKGSRTSPPPDFGELGTLTSLRADVGRLTGALKAANGKLDSIKSVLSEVASGRNQTVPNSTNRGNADGGGGCGGSGFEGGNDVGAVATPVAVGHHGMIEFGGWIGGGGKSDVGILRGSQASDVRGAPPFYVVGPSSPQGVGYFPIYPPPPQARSSTQRYLVGLQQVGNVGALPPDIDEPPRRSGARFV